MTEFFLRFLSLVVVTFVVFESLVSFLLKLSLCVLWVAFIEYMFVLF